jgi:serine/threonine-protein kinase
LADQEELGERLRREGELLQWLTHPNIVISHGHGTTAEGRPYVVLERLVGSTLRQELTRRGALPLREAVFYTRQLLAALGAVHRAGLVHRDVKPGNVMLCPAGHHTRLKLLDFGVAKVAGDARRLVAPIAFPTRDGVCLGTPRYVSPEQASGLDVDRRSDIYAAGMLLYTLLAGRGPFDDVVGVERLLAAHIGTAAPPPSRFMSTPLDPAVEAVILCAVAKDPAERFSDVASFGRELGRASRLARGTRHAPLRRFLVAKPYPQRATIDRCHLRRVAAHAPHAPYRRPLAEPSGGAPDGLTVLRPCPDERRRARSAASNEVARPAISRRAVGFSAAAFFAIAGGLAMWFVR